MLREGREPIKSDMYVIQGTRSQFSSVREARPRKPRLIQSIVTLFERQRSRRPNRATACLMPDVPNKTN